MTKPNKFERSYRDTTPIRGVVAREYSNPTPLHRSVGMLAFSCDHCGIPILKHFAHAKRANKHFCGRGCADAARRVRVSRLCVVCNCSFEVIPSALNKIVTCSRKCLKKNRKRLMDTQVANISNSAVFNFGKYFHFPKKLSEDQIRSILKDQRKQLTIAKEYGVTQSLISLIKTGKVWRIFNEPTAHTPSSQPPSPPDTPDSAAGQ